MDLYEAEILDKAIAVAIEENSMDIVNFRNMIREYNAGRRSLEVKAVEKKEQVTESALTRECGYYERIAQEVHHASNDTR